MWAQEEFLTRLERVVSRKQSHTITLEEGWYSEKEMKDDLGWSPLRPETYKLHGDRPNYQTASRKNSLLSVMSDH